MRTNSRTCRRLRNVLAALAVIAAAYHGARAAGSLHDTWSFTAALILGTAAFAAGARVHVLQARDRSAAVARRGQRQHANGWSLNRSTRVVATIRDCPAVPPAELDPKVIDPEVVAAARRIERQLLKPA